jgi:hypothetical protein
MGYEMNEDFLFRRTREKPELEKDREKSRLCVGAALGVSVIRSYDTFSEKPADGNE